MDRIKASWADAARAPSLQRVGAEERVAGADQHAAAEPAGRCVDTWRTCHDAFTAVMYADALRAGIAGRAEPHSLFSDLLPPPQPGSRRRRREGIVPDALLERPAAADEARGDGLHRTLHDCKAVHFGPTRYRQAWVLDDERRCVDHIGLATCTPATSATLDSWMRHIILTSWTLPHAPSSFA